MNVGGWAIGVLSCLAILGIIYGIFKIKKKYFSIN